VPSRGRGLQVAGGRGSLRPATRGLRPQKLLLSIALPLYFCILYFGLERVVFFVPHQFALSRVDQLIRFDPRWTVVYQSLYLLLPMPWLASSRRQLHRYVHGFFILTMISFLFFFAFPVEGPRPDEMANDPRGAVGDGAGAMEIFSRREVAAEAIAPVLVEFFNSNAA